MIKWIRTSRLPIKNSLSLYHFLSFQLSPVQTLPVLVTAVVLTLGGFVNWWDESAVVRLVNCGGISQLVGFPVTKAAAIRAFFGTNPASFEVQGSGFRD